MDTQKVKLTKENFLDWYFSDRDDILYIGNRIIGELKAEGKANVTTRELLDGCGELPSYIMEGYRDNEDEWIDTKYFEPSEIELI